MLGNHIRLIISCKVKLKGFFPLASSILFPLLRLQEKVSQLDLQEPAPGLAGRETGHRLSCLKWEVRCSILLLVGTRTWSASGADPP